MELRNWNGVLDRPALRRFLSDKFCGCGNPEAAAARLLWLLEMHPLFDHRDEFQELIADDGIEYLLLYWLDSMDLTEHGGSVGGGWLTPFGETVRDALRHEQADSFFEALLVSHCIHGFDVGDRAHDCISAPDPVDPWDRKGSLDEA